MSHTLGTYSFLPFLRNGVAGLISSPDAPTAVALRASLHVELTLTGIGGNPSLSPKPFPRDVELYGPGDVVGIDRRGIVRMEPRHWGTNVEPNYLAHIEFYDEDFPWRYTPAVASGERLRPWITLVVLAEGEFQDDLNPDERRARKPEERQSARITFDTAAKLIAAFPPPDQLWAWAHVHVNRSLTASDAEVESSTMPSVLSKLHGYLDEDPDLAFSRIICPRKLAADTPYHAFVVPSFESGRLAALGLDHTKAPSATHSAWDPYPLKASDTSMPYYHRWFFRTGGAGDFESLVRLLEFKPVDSRVGTRDLDVRAPGNNIPPIEELGGVLKLGGALKVPDANYTDEEKTKVNQNENWDQPYPRPFQTHLARRINLADDYSTQQAPDANARALNHAPLDDDDPMIAPPLYGMWHSLTKRLLLQQNDQPVANATNWVHKANLDPRHRVAAGFGTRVIQQNQEQYMEAAWGQVDKVLEANRQIRINQLARHLSLVLYEKHLLPIQRRDAARALLLTAPVFGGVVSGGVTLRYKMTQSLAQPAVASVVTRRMLRPGGRARRLTITPFAPGAMVRQLAAGTIAAAPIRAVPSGAVTVAKFSSMIPAARRPAALGEIVGFHRGTRRAAAIPALPKSPNFTVAPLGSTTAPTQGNTDSAEATRFKTAAREGYAFLDANVANAPKLTLSTLDVNRVVQNAITELDPKRAIRARLGARVKLPPYMLLEIGSELVEALAYPIIDDPMYKPLKDLSPDLLLPNINLIPPNSVTLLETNQPFIEAYMLGLNHEFARELLWREYPTDQRGSTFRQFWDATDSLAAAQGDLEQAKELLRDITKMHKWSKQSLLGTHNNRKPPSDTAIAKDLVLVIRGELLKRYPTAVIYAQRAQWQKTAGGRIDPTLGREFVPLPDAQEDNPPREIIRTPLYEAKVDPDIYFFGFDLNTTEVIGGTGEAGDTDAGWFFVIKERPGEPRFGLDSAKQPGIKLWNDFSWPDVQPGAAGSFIQITAATPTLNVGALSANATDAMKAQHDDDDEVTWGPNMSSADLAYILFQAPVMIAVHGAEMLRPN